MVFPDNRSKETGAMFQISMFSGTSEAPRSGWTVVQWCHNGITSHPEPSNSCVQLEVLWVILKVFRWWSCRTGTRWKITSSKLMAAACWELQENIVFSWKICPTGRVYLAWFFEKVSHCYDFIGSSATSTNLDHIYTYLLLLYLHVPNRPDHSCTTERTVLYAQHMLLFLWLGCFEAEFLEIVAVSDDLDCHLSSLQAAPSRWHVGHQSRNGSLETLTHNGLL